MEQTPVPASPKIPTSQQEAQDTVLRYLQQTVDALPKGTTLDGTRYAIGDGTAYCEDNPSGPDTPVHVEDWRDMTLPPGYRLQRDHCSHRRHLETVGLASH
jgi:hypothetical protein